MHTGYLFIILATLCWGFVGIFSSLVFDHGVEPMEVAFWRATLAWPCFAMQALIRKETHLDKKDIPFFVIFAVFGIFLFYVSYLFAVKTGGAAFAAVLLYTAPGWVILVSFFVYRERVTWMKLMAVIFVVSGVFLISKTGSGVGVSGSISVIAIVAGLTSGFCYSLYYTLGKYFSNKYSSSNLFLYVLPLGSILIFPFVEFVHKPVAIWGWLLAISVISTFIANCCYYQGLKYLEAGKAAIVATSEPVIAAVAAYLFLGEYFTSLGYLGAGLIFTAVIATICER